MARISIFRVVAVLLVLLTGVELFSCEMLSPNQCESFGLPQPHQNTQQADDSCICCCAHILVASFVPVIVHLGVVGFFEETEPQVVEQARSSVYHPPKA